MPTYIVPPESSCTIIVIQDLRYEKRNDNNCTTLWHKNSWLLGFTSKPCSFSYWSNIIVLKQQHYKYFLFCTFWSMHIFCGDKLHILVFISGRLSQDIHHCQWYSSIYAHLHCASGKFMHDNSYSKPKVRKTKQKQLYHFMTQQNGKNLTIRHRVML